MKKIRLNRLLVCAILIYVIFNSIIYVIGKNTKTVVLDIEDIELKLNQKGLIVRDEYLINAPSDGIIEIETKENEKIKKNDCIALLISGNQTKKEVSELALLQEDIKGLQYQLEEESIESKKNTINRKIKLKDSQIEIIENKLKDDIQEIKSQDSGVISYKSDGKEDVYTIEDIEYIDENDIDKEVNSFESIRIESEKTAKGEPVSRLIKSNNTYIVMALDETESKEIENNKNIKISKGDQIINCTIDDIYNKGEYYLYKLKIQEENIEIYDTRVEEFDIIYTQRRSLKVPKSAITQKNKIKGIYIVDSETKEPKFTELKLDLYEDNEYVYIDYYDSEDTKNKNIEIYDEVILNPNLINTKLKVK